MVAEQATTPPTRPKRYIKDDQTQLRCLKLWWGSVGTGNVLGVIFGERDETIGVTSLLIDRMKQGSTLSITRRQLRFFAEDLNSGKLGMKYSYHNFYTKLIRKLIDLGLLEKGMIWNPEKKTTQRVYQLKLQQIPDRPPPSGFVRRAWYIAKEWNDLVQGGSFPSPVSDSGS